MKSVRYQIFGRVQGVAYRAFIRGKARELGVCGWVKNMPDGSVECLAMADDEILEIFAAELSKGPRRAKVRRIEKNQVLQVIKTSTFEISY